MYLPSMFFISSISSDNEALHAAKYLLKQWGVKPKDRSRVQLLRQ